MATTAVQSNNKLIQFAKEINREFVRQNMFSPYMGDDATAIIRRRFELKSGGEQMNIPLVTKLTGAGYSTGTLAGAEEAINNYGMRVWLDFLRWAVAITNAEVQKDSADLFGEAKPLLSDFAKEKLRDELIQGFMALPSESAPANLGTTNGQRVNGILFASATAAQRNTWLANNVDRVLFGNLLSNHYGAATIATFTSACSVIVSQRFSATICQMLKRRAELCAPKIRPYKTKDGYEYYVCFMGTNSFRDAKTDATINAANLGARPREARGFDDQPIFQDGDLMYDGVILRKVPEISTFVTSGTVNGFAGWDTLVSGSVSGRVEPVFLCGQQAATVAVGRAIKPTFRKEDDYGFVNGTGIETAYGVAKIFKSHPMYLPNTSVLNSDSSAAIGGGATSLVQWGTVTGFVYAAADV